MRAFRAAVVVIAVLFEVFFFTVLAQPIHSARARADDLEDKYKANP